MPVFYLFLSKSKLYKLVKSTFNQDYIIFLTMFVNQIPLILLLNTLLILNDFSLGLLCFKI